MSRTVLVTGGAGYIGSHTCKELARQGFTPVTFDNLKRGQRAAVKWGPLFEGDLANKADLREAFQRFAPEAVIHFAAFAYVEESVRDPGAYFRNNVGGTLNLLEAMAEAQVTRLVFSSTCAVYGIPQTTPITEAMPTAPINPYGESKLQIERMLPWFEAAHRLKWVALRYFNAAGCDPEGEIGECHDPETHLIPLALQAALGDGPPLRVFGTDYPTRDGSAVRDYIHVGDLADAHIKAVNLLSRGGDSAVFNLGTGNGYSVKQIVDEIEKVSGNPLPHSFAPRRAGDPPQLVADAGQAERVLGWRPVQSDLTNIVTTALNWERKKRLWLAA
jgi:UDP-arabinose 4-epimerase